MVGLLNLNQKYQKISLEVCHMAWHGKKFAVDIVNYEMHSACHLGNWSVF